MSIPNPLPLCIVFLSLLSSLCNGLFVDIGEISHGNGAPRWAIVSIVGNDLPPRHSNDQAVVNTRFMLDNEQHLTNDDSVARIWILNRIANQTALRAIKASLLDRQQHVVNIPFDLERWKKLYDSQQGQKVLATSYATNQNAARNLALEMGRSMGAEWIAVLDGNNYLSPDGWAALRSAKTSASHFCVPMYRSRWRNEELKARNFSVAGVDKQEPQIAFRFRSRRAFIPNIPYGADNKVELLERLRRENQCPPAGFTIRLYAGVDKGATHWKERDQMRKQAIPRLTETLLAKWRAAHTADT